VVSSFLSPQKLNSTSYGSKLVFYECEERGGRGEGGKANDKALAKSEIGPCPYLEIGFFSFSDLSKIYVSNKSEMAQCKLFFCLFHYMGPLDGNILSNPKDPSSPT
jgi:hypothetical protein